MFKGELPYCNFNIFINFFMEFISQKRNAIDGDSVMKNDIIMKKNKIKRNSANAG
jgi:hypothetical protein